MTLASTPSNAAPAPRRADLRLTMTAAIHARFAHRVDGLIH